MWRIEAYSKADEFLAYELMMPTIDDETVRRVLGITEEGDEFRYYVYRIPSNTATEVFASYIEGEFEFDDSVKYKIAFEDD
ncbi:hypothetical protein Srot_2952 [Segniliparus rotundus DSM 44985]|uniref:DUF7683 domain-containing protein n=1 Tax=Segniliparus rotundus (strain ATCC BAA-972 / CDC 1076 / CIP 108378 / DSM 44985 / JCM 13578) TaxID=640132 RepID=D6ZDX4_SEGRD|nr:hypothetical protein [Segniliparus rotundus]ADG99381.1 hypothetical protein Srot_2952 [Segniliparus rotundus DSM 44985]